MNSTSIQAALGTFVTAAGGGLGVLIDITQCMAGSGALQPF